MSAVIPPKLEKWLEALGICLGIAVVLVLGGFIYLDREYSRDKAFAETSDLSKLYKAYIELTVSQLDQELMFLAAVVKEQELVGARQNLDAIVHHIKANSSLPINLVITDADGRILHRTMRGQAPADLKGREHFKAHREGRAQGLLVTQAMPYLTEPDKFLIALSRRLDDDQGRFMGVAIVVVDSLDLSQALLQQHVAEGSSVALFHASGSLISRAPYRADLVGRSPAALGEFARSDRQSEQIIDLLPLDGIERLIAQVKLDKVPLIVSVTQNYHRVLSEWRARAALTVVLGLVMLGGITLSVRLLANRVGQQRALQAQLEYTQAQAKVGGWVWEIESDRLIWTDETFRIFGLSPNDPLWRRAFFKMIHPDDIDRLEHLLEKCIADGLPYKAEYRIMHPSCEWRYIFSQGELTRDETGRPKLVQGVLQDVTERYNVEQKVAELLELNQRIISAAPIGVGVYREDGQCILANLTLARMVGGTIEAMQAANFNMLASWQRSGMQDSALRVLESGIAEELEAHTTSSFGLEMWMACRFVRFSSGGVHHLLLLAEDINDKRKAEAELRLAASVYTNTVEGIVVTDKDGIILSVNPAFTEITGYLPEEAIGRSPRILKSEHHDDAFYADMWRTLKEEGIWQGELWNRRKNGEAFLEWQSITAIQDDSGKTLRYVAVFNDVTELRKKDERIKHQAYHDALTGLPNRQLLQDRLDHAIDVALRDRARLALMFLDLDRFKTINDSLGHDVGDQLLQAVAERLKSCVRKSDTLARLGGDEFVLVLADAVNATEVAHVAEKIIGELVAPLTLSGHQVHVTTSVGIALFPDDGADATTLMKNADTAMYQAKSAGRNAFRFFDASMNSKAVERLDLEANLRRAIDRREFELFFQPKIDLQTHATVGAEALIRWRHPERGLVPPGDFIPLAEETGLIAQIGEWALKEACRLGADWERRKLLIGRIAVNLSARQLQQLNLMDIIESALREADAAPDLLEVELTESTVMANPGEAIATLGELRDRGFSIAVDDFGTGYSSLSYLKRLPISCLKIDRSFVMDLPGDADDAAIAKTIIDLARSLGLETVAEGIETQEQADHLAVLGCQKAQGYFFARPLPAKEFEEWLKRKPS